MSALALFAAQRGLQTLGGIKDTFDAQAQAQVQSANIELQMSEIETRTSMQIQNIWKGAEKVTSKQEAAFITGGVDLTGSSMAVISDTLNNAAMAAYVRQRETDYDVMSLSMEKHQYDKMASNETLFLNLASVGLGGAAGFASDMYSQKRKSTKDVGSTTIGGGGSSYNDAGPNSGLGDAYA